jgi:hypothetical protein
MVVITPNGFKIRRYLAAWLAYEPFKAHGYGLCRNHANVSMAI